MLIAMILLAYALGQFINTPGKLVPIQFIGVFVPIQINLNTIVSVAVSGMTATGMDWLLRDHPSLGKKSTLPHWLLPGLTAWIIHVTLTTLSVNPIWWLAFGLGGGFLFFILLAEYIVVDPDDIRYPIATAGLNALAFALFLILAVSLHSIDLRLVMLLPALSLAAGLITLRVLQLHHPTEKWPYMEPLVSLVIVAQITTALHYLPISPLGFGLALLGLMYAFVNFQLNLEEGIPLNKAMRTPLIVLGVLWPLAILL